MARIDCPHGLKPRPSAEWYDGVKYRYYCYGYFDLSTEETMEICVHCDKYFERAQDDLDEWNNKKQEG